MVPILVVLTATGFSDAELRGLDEQLAAEVRARGAEIVRAEPMPDACVVEPECVTAVVEQHDAAGVLVLRLVRVGRIVDVDVTVLDNAGAVVSHETRSARLEALESALLPDTLRLPKAPPDERDSDDVEIPPPKEPSTLGVASIVAGAVVGAAGATAMALGLVTLNDSRSLGNDKRVASVVAPIGGAVLLAGAAVATLGIALVVVE